jgi:DNA processing protein
MQNCFPDGAGSGAGERGNAPGDHRYGAAGTRCLEPGDADYPAALRDLHDPPPQLWARGRLVTAAPPVVAIVGSRNASPYGIRAAKVLASACARAGVAVVSGLARGIDGAAHQATLDAGGRTVAVLGTGVDVYYPRSHRELQRRVAEDGLLLSEHLPLSSGHGGAFPRRNRLIAALASVVVVVEAGIESGALITAERAQELGRDVRVVPGPIDAPSCAGSNLLLTDYGLPVVSPQHLLELLAVDASPPAVPQLDDSAAQCWDALQRGAADLAGIARRAGLSTRAVAAAVSALELEGLVVVDAAGRVHTTMERVTQ